MITRYGLGLITVFGGISATSRVVILRELFPIYNAIELLLI